MASHPKTGMSLKTMVTISKTSQVSTAEAPFWTKKSFFCQRTRGCHLDLLGDGLGHHLTEKVVALLHLYVKLCHALLCKNIASKYILHFLFWFYFLASINLVFSFSDSSASFNSSDCWLQGKRNGNWLTSALLHYLIRSLSTHSKWSTRLVSSQPRHIKCSDLNPLQRTVSKRQDRVTLRPRGDLGRSRALRGRRWRGRQPEVDHDHDHHDDDQDGQDGDRDDDQDDWYGFALTCSCSRLAMAGEQRNMTTFQSGMKFIWPLMCRDLSTSSSIMFWSSSTSSSSPPERQQEHQVGGKVVPNFVPGAPPVFKSASIDSLVISSKMLLDLVKKLQRKSHSQS